MRPSFPKLLSAPHCGNPISPLGRCQHCSLSFAYARPYSVLSLCSEHVECDRSTCSSVQEGDNAGGKHVQSLGAARVGEHPSRAASLNKNMLRRLMHHHCISCQKSGVEAIELDDSLEFLVSRKAANLSLARVRLYTRVSRWIRHGGRFLVGLGGGNGMTAAQVG